MFHKLQMMPFQICIVCKVPYNLFESISSNWLYLIMKWNENIA